MVLLVVTFSLTKDDAETGPCPINRGILDKEERRGAVRQHHLLLLKLKVENKKPTVRKFIIILTLTQSH